MKAIEIIFTGRVHIIKAPTVGLVVETDGVSVVVKVCIEIYLDIMYINIARLSLAILVIYALS